MILWALASASRSEPDCNAGTVAEHRVRFGYQGDAVAHNRGTCLCMDIRNGI